jgi:hypothetical protein
MIICLDFGVELHLKIENFFDFILVVDCKEFGGVKGTCQNGDGRKSIPDGVFKVISFVIWKAFLPNTFDDFMRF